MNNIKHPATYASRIWKTMKVKNSRGDSFTWSDAMKAGWQVVRTLIQKPEGNTTISDYDYLVYTLVDTNTCEIVSVLSSKRSSEYKALDYNRETYGLQKMSDISVSAFSNVVRSGWVGNMGD